MSSGGSCIIAPSGEFLAPFTNTGECLLYADLDLGEIPRWKFDLDVVGHYARPDIFHLNVDTNATLARSTKLVTHGDADGYGGAPEEPADETPVPGRVG